MIYTPLTKKAMTIAYEAHKNQMDKSGVPYIFHPIHLAEQCEEEATCVAALLHDVVEDCDDYSFERLSQEGIPANIIEALKLLTHEKNVPYLEYVRKIKENPIARKVKLLDLTHNLDEARLDQDVAPEVRERLQKKRETYREAVRLLQE